MSIAKTRYVAIDYGLKRIGLALSDESGSIAMPLGCIEGKGKLEATVQEVHKALKELMKEKECSIAEVIVGLPLMMNGSFGLQADEVKLFAEKLAELSGLSVKLWDERLTSVQAERSMRQAGLSRKKRVGKVDAVAAALLLQSYLERNC